MPPTDAAPAPLPAGVASAAGRSGILDGVGRVTLQTVADRVGVSRMTVSNAFSRPDQLSPELRRKILAAADELGYAGPDPAGRALARGRTGAVGVILTDSVEYAFTDQVATDLMAAITAELAPTGVALTLLTSATGDDWVPARDVPLDGAIVFSCTTDSDAVDWLRRRKLPMVFVDQDPDPTVPSINVDDRGGARAAAEHVLELGHRRVAVIGSSLPGPTGPSSIEAVSHAKRSMRERMLGWLDALTPAGVMPEVVNVAHETGAATTAAVTVLDRPAGERPTAVLCYSDLIALGVLQAAKQIGLSVPGDVSIVGYDDARFAATTEPPLTTVHQDTAAKGRAAAAALAAAVRDGDDASSPIQTVLPTHLVIRGSTAPPPST
jgi:DNA-binding LacI/PurR family transcriptional regulator